MRKVLKHFFLGHPTAVAIVTVSVLLICAFVVTGFVSSAYKNKQRALGEHNYQWGIWHQSHGQTEAAISEFRKALLYQPDNVSYRISLAAALVAVGRLSEAHAHLEQLLQENPTDGLINLMMARVELREHQPQKALSYYERAVYGYWPASQLSQRRQARWELVHLLAQLGDRNAEIAELMQLNASAPPNEPGDRPKIGFLLLQNGAVSEASQIFHTLARSFPHDAEVYRGLGQIAFLSGEFVTARHDFERALHLDAHDMESAQALKLTETVIHLDPVLPGIGVAERLRRSQNLLNRVLDDLEQCLEGRQAPNPVAQDIAAATKLLSAKAAPEGDLIWQREDLAQQLWKDAAKVCGAVPDDKAVETVLARMGT